MKRFRKFIKESVPPFFIFLKNAIPVYYYDLVRFYKYSATNGVKNKKQLTGQIIKTYHVIEKGLSMPNTRFGFGKDPLNSLISLCSSFKERFGESDEQYQHAIGVIIEYEEFHKLHNHELDIEILKKIDKLKNDLSIAVLPGKQVEVGSNDYFKDSASDFVLFSNSRHSVRNYSEEEVPLSLIKQSISLVRNTPSACNRQTVRAYVYSDKTQIDDILAVQGGTRGFGHLANKLIIVTAELGVFIGLNERNQGYIDGGMFAMNLLYALHNSKIAACILNCSILPSKDMKLRTLTGIKESEVFIAMISCGYVPENFKLATSRRNNIDDIIEVK